MDKLSPIERACAAVVADLFRQGDLMAADKGRIDVAQVDGSFQVEPLVRAVLTAIREPSDGMLARGTRDEPIRHRVAKQVWTDMIDAALDEK